MRSIGRPLLSFIAWAPIVMLGGCLASEANRNSADDGSNSARTRPPVYSDIWYTLSCDEAKSRLDVAFYAYNLMEQALGDLLDEGEWCLSFTYAHREPKGVVTCHYNISKPVRLADPDEARRRCPIPLIDPAQRIVDEYPVGDFHPHWNGTLPSEIDTRPNSAVTEAYIYGQRDFPEVGYIRFVSPRKTQTGEPRRMYLIDAKTGKALRNGDGVPVPRLTVPKLPLDVKAQTLPQVVKP